MRWLLPAACAATVIACSASPPPEPAAVTPSQPAVVAPAAAPEPAPAPPAAQAGTAATAPPATAPPAAAPPACPAGMKLIEGDYCTEVRQKCLITWYAPQNRKQVCEQFEPSTECVGKRVPKRYCIDTYAWPNRQGARPEVMNTFWQAQIKCVAAGKRMCTESEWTFACEGPEMKPFPHGYIRDPRKCNGDHQWDSPRMKLVAQRDPTELARLWRGVPSGSQPDCISDFGVADLPGNNDEVVAGESYKAKFSAVNTGGPWYSGVRNQCRPKVYTHAEDFYYYFLGFRCCSEPDGAQNEPRTLKQIRDGTSFAVVERYAGFTLAQMQDKLELKQQGRCTCAASDILCKTMCGTLLGPGAVDGSDATRVPHRSRQKIKP